MKLSNIVELIEQRIPKDLALENDFIGLMDNYDLNQDIKDVYIIMDIYPKDIPNFDENDLIITHHKPLFTPEIPTYVLHSNWDIIEGGANEALAEKLGLEAIDVFDKDLGIGRICSCNQTFEELSERIIKEFPFSQIVGRPENIDRVAVVSGFGLKNPDYIRLASENRIDVLISGDLTQETGVLANNLGVCLINLGHHFSEVPGLHKLKKTLLELGIHAEVMDNGAPWKQLNISP